MANILVVGKDLPESTDFIKSFELQNYKICTTLNPNSEISVENESIFAFSWNKASSISAKNLLIQAETKLGAIDCVLIVFDGLYYSTKFTADRLEDCTPAIETMISGYMYFCQTLLARLAQKTDKITVGFFLKSISSRLDSLNQKNASSSVCANSVAVAQKAFEAMAENYSLSMLSLPHVSTFLSCADNSNELFASDRESGSWLAGIFTSISELKNRMSPKQSSVWIKAGGKLPSGFPFFR